ncbi:hypothetical protein HanRHA438_Chr04g0195671 [Helianthus annuus]|nr:hypothetical protein HanRHA438_Chr04g0195671 [Helianthus annuus]
MVVVNGYCCSFNCVAEVVVPELLLQFQLCGGGGAGVGIESPEKMVVCGGGVAWRRWLWCGGCVTRMVVEMMKGVVAAIDKDGRKVCDDE